MEDNITIITTKWAIMTQEMVTQTVDTPQGKMQIQQPIQVPIVFRNMREVHRYIDETNRQGELQIILQKIQYDINHEKELKFYYEEQEN